MQAYGELQLQAYLRTVMIAGARASSSAAPQAAATKQRRNKKKTSKKKQIFRRGDTLDTGHFFAGPCGLAALIVW